jgi:hypothetical protein
MAPSEGRKTLTICFGNTDGKLAQDEWSQFCHSMRQFVLNVATQVFAQTYAAPDAPWQNAAFVFEVPVDRIGFIREQLGKYAAMFDQESIALMVGDSELIQASEKPEHSPVFRYRNVGSNFTRKRRNV